LSMIYWFMPQLSKMVNIGMGGGQAYEFLRGMARFNALNTPGINDKLIRKKEFLTIVRNMKGAATIAEVMRNTPKGRRQPLEDMALSPYAIKTNYFYRYEADIKDPITGQPTTVFRSLMIDDPLFSWQADPQMLTLMQTSGDLKEDEITGLKLIDAYKKDPNLARKKGFG